MMVSVMARDGSQRKPNNAPQAYPRRGLPANTNRWTRRRLGARQIHSSRRGGSNLSNNGGINSAPAMPPAMIIPPAIPAASLAKPRSCQITSSHVVRALKHPCPIKAVAKMMARLRFISNSRTGVVAGFAARDALRTGWFSRAVKWNSKAHPAATAASKDMAPRNPSHSTPGLSDAHEDADGANAREEALLGGAKPVGDQRRDAGYDAGNRDGDANLAGQQHVEAVKDTQAGGEGHEGQPALDGKAVSAAIDQGAGVAGEQHAGQRKDEYGPTGGQPADAVLGR